MDSIEKMEEIKDHSQTYYKEKMPSPDDKNRPFLSGLCSQRRGFAIYFIGFFLTDNMTTRQRIKAEKDDL